MKITVSTEINASVEDVREKRNTPQDIMEWCHASDDRHAPAASNDLRVWGKFSTTMAARDASVSFDFGGIYTTVVENELIEYTMDDGRTVSIRFEETEDGRTVVTEIFDAEEVNSEELQKAGRQAILENFKKHVETNA